MDFTILAHTIHTTCGYLCGKLRLGQLQTPVHAGFEQNGGKFSTKILIYIKELDRFSAHAANNYCERRFAVDLCETCTASQAGRSN